MDEWFFHGSFGKGCFHWISYTVIIGVCLVSAFSGSQTVICGQVVFEMIGK